MPTNLGLYSGAVRSAADSQLDLNRELSDLVTQENYEGYLPNQSLFEEQFAAEEQRILGRLPVSLEAYRANQASRGIFSSGEAAGAEFRDVFAPVAGEIASARTRATLGFEQLRLQQKTALLGFKHQAVQLALEKYLGEEAAKAQREAAKWGAIGSLAGTAVGTYGAFS